MITSELKTSRKNFAVPQQLLLGLLVLSAWVLTSATPAWGDGEGQQCTAAPSGLVGWWPGDGNYKDITPSDHDGMPKDDDTHFERNGDVPFTAGEVGQAFLFDGDNDYVQIPNAPDLNIPSGKITVHAWINPTTLGQYYPSILSKGDQGPLSKESYALFLAPGGNVGFFVNSTGAPAGRGIVFGSTPINGWTFVAGTYDGASVNVYVNGKLDGTVSHSGGIHTTTDSALIGKSQRTLDNNSYFNGAIDEVELFNRALSGGTATASGGQLGAIYAAGHSGKCKCQKKPAESDGDVENDDGTKSHESMTAKRECDDNGEIDYKDDRGTEMKGRHRKVTTSNNTAMVSGQGTLQDGTPVDYTAVLVGNQPLIGANLFSITWTTATGSFYHKSGVMLDGYTIVPPQ